MNNRNHQKQEKHFIVDILFVLALFGVFAVSALALVTIGADVYQHTVEDMGVNYESRTLFRRHHQTDHAGLYSNFNDTGRCRFCCRSGRITRNVDSRIS